MTNTSKSYLQKIERVNALSHGLGGFAALVAAVIMGRQMFELNPGASQFPFFFYVGSLCGTLWASAIYHSLSFTKYGRTAHLVDHLSIYLLIAGTNTPIVLRYMEYHHSWGYLLLLYSLCAIGVILKIRYLGKYKRLLTYFYVLLGWLAVLAFPLMWSNMPTAVAGYILLGGLAYSIGVYFYLRDRNPWLHVVWHSFVLLGAFFHFRAIWHIYLGSS